MEAIVGGALRWTSGELLQAAIVKIIEEMGMSVQSRPAALHIPSAVAEPAAYKQALLTLAGDGEPLDLIVSTPAKVGELCAYLTIEQLTAPPEPGEWSVAQIVGHLWDVDVVYGFRWRLVLTESNPAYPGYDENRWAALSRLPFWQLLNAWRDLRACNVALLRHLSPFDRQRTGCHGEQGPETMEEMVRKVAGHDLAHLNQLERAACAALGR